jgi:hypothetical protein
MKRQLIETEQEFLVVCDNKECGYQVVNETKSPDVCTKEYINKPCPNCGQNLLTFDDYMESEKFLAKIKWINKWFSWLLFFTPKSIQVEERVSVHHHEGKVTIEHDKK